MLMTSIHSQFILSDEAVIFDRKEGLVCIILFSVFSEISGRHLCVWNVLYITEKSMSMFLCIQLRNVRICINLDTKCIWID